MDVQFDKLKTNENGKKNRIIGSFVIRDEKNGCLTSLYFNEPGKGTFPESCNLKQSKGKEKFEDEYYTSWHEDNGKIINGLLKIVAVKNPYGNNDYSLEWREFDLPNLLIFVGEAFLYEDNLTGAYWSVQ